MTFIAMRMRKEHTVWVDLKMVAKVVWVLPSRY